MTHTFNPTILREYDIRGIVGDTLDEADAYALGRTFAAQAREEDARRIAVGRDGRTHSGMLEAALVRGLTEGGIDVVLTGMGPSPMLYFATHYLDVDGGIQVTGSHNPADYNGFKLLLKGRSGRRSRRLASAPHRVIGARGTARPKRSISAKLTRTGCSRAFRGSRSASAGTPATAPPGRSSTCWSSGCPAISM
jgi:hypothetical protein